VVVGLVILGALPETAFADTPRPRDAGAAVVLWQKMLNMWAAAPGPPRSPRLLAEDGVFGPRTGAATRRFEVPLDRRADGVVQQSDRRAWLGAFITCCGAAKPTIARGSYGPLVGHLQLELDEWLRKRSASLVIDLSFGPRTETAVRAYQAAHGLTVDGVVGQETWAALLGL
jgi:peptidoglycan hydrolase-like protein with peptidoglycan-binding domain